MFQAWKAHAGEMTGIPRTRRCQRCKRMKTKCDEKFPQCGACSRAKVNCSGPPTVLKFVHNHNQYGANVAEAPTFDAAHGISAMHPANQEHLERIIVPVSTKGAGAGSSFAKFRLYNDGPRSNPTTLADRTAARLVGQITLDNADRDMLSFVGYMPYLPARLGNNAALRDCVALQCSAWTKFKRGASCKDVIDPGVYGKALRSLQRAIEGPEKLECETLAAATIIDRIEVLFDSGRPYHRSRHAAGMQTIMKARGPPKLDDDLDVQLALENHAVLLSLWTVHGGKNFYLTSPWKETIRNAIDSPNNKSEAYASYERRSMLSLGIYLGYGPELLWSFRRILAEANPVSRQLAILSLRTRVTQLDEEFKLLGDPIVARLYESKHVIEELDDFSPFGTKVAFSSIVSMQAFLNYAVMRVIFNRFLHNINSLIEAPGHDLELEHREMCRQIWMCIPHIRSLGEIAMTFFSMPLYLSYSGAHEDERAYLLDFAIESAAYKGRLPKDERAAVETFILNTERAIIGQMPFDLSLASSQSK